jgi:tetratricopeptide (TPR) repeat protein
VEQAKIDFAEALALLKAEAENLKVDKSDTKNLESKAEAVEKKAPKTDATTKMIAVVDNYPELSGPAYNLAYYYYQLDYDNDAIKYLDIATARNYYNVEAHNLKAKIYRDRSDFENAEKAYKEAIAAWGGYLPAYKNIGIMYDLYMGQPEKAYEYYKQYNDYNPEEDRQVIGWAVVIERKMKAQQMMAEREAQAKAAAEAQRQAEEAAANAASAAESQSEQPEQVSGQQDTAATEEPAEQNTAVDAALEAAEAEQANTEAE